MKRKENEIMKRKKGHEVTIFPKNGQCGYYYLFSMFILGKFRLKTFLTLWISLHAVRALISSLYQSTTPVWPRWISLLIANSSKAWAVFPGRLQYVGTRYRWKGYLDENLHTCAVEFLYQLCMVVFSDKSRLYLGCWFAQDSPRWRFSNILVDESNFIENVVTTDDLNKLVEKNLWVTNMRNQELKIFLFPTRSFSDEMAFLG